MSGGQAPRVLDTETEHTLKNHLAVILGYCDLLLTETAQDDPRYVDLVEVQRAAQAMVSIFDNGGES